MENQRVLVGNKIERLEVPPVFLAAGGDQGTNGEAGGLAADEAYLIMRG